MNPLLHQPQTQPVQQHSETEDSLSSNQNTRKVQAVSLDIRWHLVIILWSILFSYFFYSFDLPNNNIISRVALWQLLPDNLFENISPLPDPESTVPRSHYSGWHFLYQRIPLAGMILLISLGAWGWGSILLRWLKLDEKADQAERLGLSLAMGLGLLSLLTLGLGYCGVLWRGIFYPVLLIPFMYQLFLCKNHLVQLIHDSIKRMGNPHLKYRVDNMVIYFLMGCFLWAMFLGAVLPETDFDVREYHLQGPKEYFQDGRISMLKHNVYTSFPFLTEMLSLLSMVLVNDWFYGSLIGKGLLMTFAPISALLIYALAKRVWSQEAGLTAALIYLSTPWVYRISIIAYTEGALCCYTIATLLACTRCIEACMLNQNSSETKSVNRSFAWSLLTGMLAGCAVSTKYPGLVTVSIPLCMAVLIAPCYLKLKGEQTQASVLKLALGLTLGMLITFGPWVMKNLYETGNPVYPLMYGIFGGEDLTPELNAKWKKGHAPDNYHLRDLAEKFIDVTMKSDWQSPLVFLLLPIACIIPTQKRWLASWYALYVLWYFAIWWLFTHRLDRFWVPLLPVASLVAGMSFSILKGYSKVYLCVTCIAGIIFNLAFVTTALCGNNSYLYDLTQARETFAVKTIHKLEPKMKNVQGKVLCVGEAQVFDARYRVIYNTVFDHSLFEQWCTTSPPLTSDGDWTLRDTAEIKSIFKKNQVKFILVNWQEILRYRETYGYTRFVIPKRFRWLEQQKIISQPFHLNSKGESTLRELSTFNATTQTLIKNEMPELILIHKNIEYVQMLEYYEVLE